MAKQAVQRLIKLDADSNGNVVVPDRIHLMSAGHWHTPWHGAFEMTAADLADMVIHFEDGIGAVEGSKKLPINYGHDISGKAAGWVTALSLENNGTELWGDIEWTPHGKQMLADGEFRYISPEWNPRDFPWENPEVEGEMVDNVFTGAGLTNIPLFKKLQPIMASIDVGGSDKSTKPKGGDMDLETLRVKKLEELSDEEKTFLAEHKADLTDDERKTFELEDGDDDAEAKAQADKEAADKKAADEAAAAEAGKQASANGAHGLTAAQVTQLQADAAAGREAQQELLRTRMASAVDVAVSKGAIVADQHETAVSLLMASRDEKGRTQLLDFISNLPENKILASEIGSGSGEAGSAQDELADRAAKVVKETAGKTKFADAMAGIMASDSSLRERVNAERANQQ